MANLNFTLLTVNIQYYWQTHLPKGMDIRQQSATDFATQPSERFTLNFKIK